MQNIFSENFKHRLNIASIIFAISLAPLTVLILVSQNTVPGDFFYPAKRSMENVVLAAAVVHPATRVAFRTDLTEKRFDEAETLVLTDSNNLEGFKEFVGQVQAASEEVSNISDSAEKEKLKQEFRNSFSVYKERTAKIKAKLIASESLASAGESTPENINRPTNTPVPQPTEISLPTNTPVPLPTSSLKNPTNTPVPRPTFVPRPTNTPVPLPTNAPVLTAPTLTLTPALVNPPTSRIIVIKNSTLTDWQNCIDMHFGDDNFFCEPAPEFNPNPTPTPVPTLTPTAKPGVPTNTPTPTKPPSRLFDAITPQPLTTPTPTPTQIVVPTEIPTPTSIPTPTPPCVSGWNSSTCSLNGGPDFSDFGDSSLCGWSEEAWQSCDARKPVQGAKIYKPQTLWDFILNTLGIDKWTN